MASFKANQSVEALVRVIHEAIRSHILTLDRDAELTNEAACDYIFRAGRMARQTVSALNASDMVLAVDSARRMVALAQLAASHLEIVHQQRVASRKASHAVLEALPRGGSSQRLKRQRENQRKRRGTV